MMADRETDSRARRKIREAAERHGFEVEWLNWEPIDGCGCGGWTVVVKGYGTAGGNSWPEAVEEVAAAALEQLKAEEAVMEGRWLLNTASVPFVVGPKPFVKITEPTWVVPCDDAAVERVARHLAESRGWQWDVLEVSTADLLRSRARDCLRAAGGQDAA